MEQNQIYKWFHQLENLSFSFPASTFEMIPGFLEGLPESGGNAA